MLEEIWREKQRGIRPIGIKLHPCANFLGVGEYKGFRQQPSLAASAGAQLWRRGGGD